MLNLGNFFPVANELIFCFMLGMHIASVVSCYDQRYKHEPLWKSYSNVMNGPDCQQYRHTGQIYLSGHTLLFSVKPSMKVSYRWYGFDNYLYTLSLLLNRCVRRVRCIILIYCFKHVLNIWGCLIWYIMVILLDAHFAWDTRCMWHCISVCPSCGYIVIWKAL